MDAPAAYLGGHCIDRRVQVRKKEVRQGCPTPKPLGLPWLALINSLSEQQWTVHLPVKVTSGHMRDKGAGARELCFSFYQAAPSSMPCP